MNLRNAEEITRRCREIKELGRALTGSTEGAAVVGHAIADLATFVETLARESVRIDSAISCMPINDGGRYR